MEKVKFAALQIIDYKVTGGYFQAVSETAKVSANLQALPISVEYSILTDKGDGVLIDVEVKCNTSAKPKPGYSFEFSAQAKFEIDVELENRDQLIMYSGLPMVINNLRGYLSTITAQSWFGPYLLPAIDVNDVIKKHIKNQEK
jgi:preprotein translocase subunit SecB